MENNQVIYKNDLLTFGDYRNVFDSSIRENFSAKGLTKKLPEILFITTYPPRECGIATYSQDLINSIQSKFTNSFKIRICALESDTEMHIYSKEVIYKLNTDQSESFLETAKHINENMGLQMVLIQHEFGLFSKNEIAFQEFIQAIKKPIIFVFHTVLPNPNDSMLAKVQQLIKTSAAVIVMTNSSAKILMKDYGILAEKITIIPHGTHLVSHSEAALLKAKYHLTGKKVLSTFGLLSAGKNIETTLEALPAIVKQNPDVLFLIMGKTHPTVVKQEGEKYRNELEAKIEKLKLKNHVQFINSFLPLPDLLEYLQLTDIYLFTSKDPNQAVSGTFSYALSCGCPIISTPIPHALEVLKNNAGILIDFESPIQLSNAVNLLLGDDTLRKSCSSNALHMMAPTAWQNAAIAHARLFENISNQNISLNYKIPEINLEHLKKITTKDGIIQFSIINQPDLGSGYTLDDNARAMVAMCQHYELTHDEQDLPYITTYLNFIKTCLQPEGYFLNYINEQGDFTEQNNETNLADSNGRAIWALGYLISKSEVLPNTLIAEAKLIMRKGILNVHKIHSTRAMAFVIKGLYYSNCECYTEQNILSIRHLSDRLVQMYRHEASRDWNWFESYMTYANSILPEAMLCAYLATGDPVYKKIAKSTFDFLIDKIYSEKCISVISNKNWLHKGQDCHKNVIGGEQAIDVAYTILAMDKFYREFKDETYKQKMAIGFSWFLGNNHLNQIVYNPCTGGCYDGLEDKYVNLNQGAESTVSYLMARLTIEKPMNAIQQSAKKTEKYFVLNI